MPLLPTDTITVHYSTVLSLSLKWSLWLATDDKVQKWEVLSKCYDFYPTFMKALDISGVNMQTQAEKDAVFYLWDHN